MHKRWFAWLLALCLFLSTLPNAKALDLDTTYDTAQTQSTRGTSSLKFSEKGVDFIKDNEGFTQYANWDYGQWSIGYGSRCEKGDYPYGISKEEADRLLREYVSTFTDLVNQFATNHSLSLKQHEFDALVIFTYGCGPAWMNGCRITRWLDKRTTEVELVDAFGAWCNTGDDYLQALSFRRVLEAKIFLYGDYTGNNSPDYCCICYNNPEGGIVGESRNHGVIYYKVGKPIGYFAEAIAPNSNVQLEGWYRKDGTRIYTTDIAKDTFIVTAKWGKNLGTPKDKFVDISKNAWYYSYVSYACQRNWFTGTTATTFSPNVEMTRAMIVNVLYRMAGRPDVDYGTPFTDVPTMSWSAPSIAWAYRNHIVSGMSATTFAPNELVSREQAATFLYRFALINGYSVAKQADLESFPDYQSVNVYAKEAMQWAVGIGVINGTKEGDTTYLRPQATATRAQGATLLVQFAQYYKI